MLKRRNLGDTFWNIFNYSALILLALACLYPFVWVTAASLSHPDEVIAGNVYLWPQKFTWMAYEYVLSFDQLWISYGNTLFYVVVGTTLNVVLTMMTAWPLSRSWFRARGPLTAFIVFTMLFSGGMIPLFLVVKSLGLLNTRWAMILPLAIGVWEVILARAYLAANIPDALVEAAA